MRRNILFIASIASVFGSLFLIALSIALISKGSAGYGLILLVLGTPCGLAMSIVFDHVRHQMEAKEEYDSKNIDLDPIRPKFTKFGGGG